MKKFYIRLLSLSLSLFVLGTYVPAFADSPNINESELQDYSIEDYINNEILVTYEDGSIDVLNYDSEQELKSAINSLEKSSAISDIQPNFVYTAEGTLTNDAYSSYQWALYNDGNFSIGNNHRNFPVYDNPFQIPTNRSNWNNPNRFINIPNIRFYSTSISKTDLNNSFSYNSSSVSSVQGIDINMKDALDVYNGGKRETIIALIDTGVDTSHEDFGDVFWKNTDEIPNNGIDDDKNGYIDDVNGWNFYSNNNSIFIGEEDNHGTHGAGSMVAASNNNIGISGIIPDGNVKIMVLKALGGSNGDGTAESVVKAIKYAEANGAKICNLSMGTQDFDNSLYNTIKNSNMIFVAAAGNDGANIDKKPSYPASFNLDNIISVANLQSDGKLHSSSNYGVNSTDLAVPGTYILSLTEGNDYSFMSGTSMSAPILSASLAMIYSSFDSISLNDAKNIIFKTTTPLNYLKNKVKTGGILNLGEAMKLADKYYGENSYYNLPYTDISRYDDAFEAVAYLYNNGIMTGTSDTKFSPDSTLTRSMIITMLGRIANVETVDTDTFTDVENNSWYSGYVGWAVTNGIIQGYGNGLFGTNDAITAEQLNLILSRYAKLRKISYNSLLNGNYSLTRKEAAQELYNFALSLG